MIEELGDDLVLLPKSIDNSRVVREVDPRSNRDLWLLVVLAAALVAALVLYAWPHFELRQTARQREEMQRERERLLEDNRKLRLEKASLENLQRVETIATRDLRLAAPEADRVYVVEHKAPLADGAQVARSLGEPSASRPERPTPVATEQPN